MIKLKKIKKYTYVCSSVSTKINENQYENPYEKNKENEKIIYGVM